MEELHSKNTGSVDEWFKSTVLKTVDSKGSVSSNLTTSAKRIKYRHDPHALKVVIKYNCPMNQDLKNIPNKILIIGDIKKGDSVLMRKKFVGSKPYVETWYSFGAEFIPGKDPLATFKDFIKGFVGIDISPTKHLSWDTETKEDHDGILKQFVYLDAEFEYVSGELIVPEGLEKVEWIPLENLSKLDIVPPSVVLFKKLGYLK